MDVTFEDGQTRQYLITGTHSDFSYIKGKDIHGLHLSVEGLQYLPPMPMFQISIPRVIAGTLIGIVVVMIASNAPAKQAAKVYPKRPIQLYFTRTRTWAYAMHFPTKKMVFIADRKKERLTVICNAISVMLVTAIFHIYYVTTGLSVGI